MPGPRVSRVSNLFALIGSQSLIALVAISGVRLYTELMAIDVFGAAMLWLGAIALADSFLAATLAQTVAVRASKIDPQNRIELALSLWQVTARHVCWIGVVSAIVTLPLLLRLKGGAPGAMAGLPLLVPYCVLEMRRAAIQSVLNINGQHRTYGLWTALESLVVLIAVSCALYIFGGSISVFLFSYLVAKMVVNLAVGHFATNGAALWLPSRHVAGDERRAAFAYGWPFLVMALIGWLGNFGDRFAISAGATATSVGIYAAGSGLVSRPVGLLSSLLTLFFRPRLLSGTNGRGHASIYSEALRRWLGFAAFGGLSIFILLILTKSFVLPIVLAAEYREGANGIVGILAGAAVATLITHALDNAVFAHGNSRVLILPQVLGVAVSLGAMFILAGRYGAIGAACGKFLGEYIRMIAAAASLRLVHLKKRHV